jgi:glyoxylase-like metal-dependent hydrolase (beta-lactamase superfamily II)
MTTAPDVRSATRDMPALAGLSVFERGWLSSNNVLIHGHGEGATLVDTSHVLHAAQTVALVRQGLARDVSGEALVRVLNTHLHSDHCGGNAAVQREFGVPVHIPPGQWAAVQAWDAAALSYEATGQRIERFSAQAQLEPGKVLALGGRQWQVLAAPGHDPHSVMLFDAMHGVLISADALWEHGFGVVFPEIEGVGAFDEVGAVLELIATLPVVCVIPGHGAPFTDVRAALARARARLKGFVADPGSHARHAAKVLLKYHLMEERSQALDDLRAWAAQTHLFQCLWASEGRHHAATPAAWCEALVHELATRGALAVRDGQVHDT